MDASTQPQEQVSAPEDLSIDFTELDDDEFELHLQHFGVEQPDNFTGPDRLRDKGVVLCGRLVEAAHGHVKQDSPNQSIHNKKPKVKDPCTLIIFEWYVHTTKPNRRIKFARIDIRFKAKDEHVERKYDPWVKDCAPWGAYSLYETEKTLEKEKSWTPSIKLGQEGIASGELAFVYDVKESVNQMEHIVVDGCPLPPADGKYFHPDQFSAVRWTLSENRGQMSGIPKYFRTAVLVNRAELVKKLGWGAKFVAEVTIKVKVSAVEDAVERVKGFLGRGVKDDDLVFNPSLPPKTNRFDDKLGNLGSGVDGVKLEDEMGFLLFKGLAPGDAKKGKDTNATTEDDES